MAWHSRSGLSAHHDESKWDSKIIKFSFSIAPGQSYALFGDWNVSQVAPETVASPEELLVFILARLLAIFPIWDGRFCWSR